VPHPVNNIQLYTILLVTSDILSLRSWINSFPPNVTFMRHLLGPRPTSCQALFQCLALVQLSPQIDEFQ
jgi:hypothetical protein